MTTLLQRVNKLMINSFYLEISRMQTSLERREEYIPLDTPVIKVNYSDMFSDLDKDITIEDLYDLLEYHKMSKTNKQDINDQLLTKSIECKQGTAGCNRINCSGIYCR